MLISVEGIDGAGKTTAVDCIRKHLLNEYRIDALVTSDLKHSSFGLNIKHQLRGTCSAAADLNLITAARIHNIDQVILPEMNQDRWVICDRYVHSTFAYQGFAQELGMNTVCSAIKTMGRLPIPDMMFLIDCDEFTAKARLAKRGQVRLINWVDPGFMEAVREGYKDCVGLSYAKEILKINNTNNSPEQFQAFVRHALDQSLQRSGIKKTKAAS